MPIRYFSAKRPLHWKSDLSSSMDRKAFNRNGLASLDDLATSEWRTLFSELESIELQFREAVEYPPNYRWPRDPLRTWSRVWEYPYVYHQLKLLRESHKEDNLQTAMDFGSGVTFFPFAVASLGYHVTCVDIDPAYKSAIEKTAKNLNLNGGSVSFHLVHSNELSLETEFYDVVYSVSVLEHIPECSKTIIRLGESLKTDGVMIATIDLDLAGDGIDGVSISQLRLVQAYLEQCFRPLHCSPTLPPSLMLTTDNSPYCMAAKDRGAQKLYRQLKDQIIKPILGRPATHRYNLTCEGWAHRKTVTP
jgi:SAM-dependent methyltransferase